MIDRERDAPDLEDLAAYVDGRLSGERKSRVEERLLRDEDYYEVFMETVRFREESAASGDGVVVAPSAWRRPRVIAPLAVAAALVAAIGLWRLGTGPSVDSRVARLDAARIVDRENWAAPGWTVLRGDNILQGRYSPEEVAFRIGTRTVDLRVALAAGDRVAAWQLTYVLQQLTGAADLLFVSAGYGDLLHDVESAALDDLTARAADLEVALGQTFADGPSPEERRFRLGAWTEVGRLAALSRNTEVLADLVRHRRLARSVAEIAPQLETLEAILERPDGDEEVFETATAAFREIAGALGG